jgi:uncharacterized protein YdeI (YjbR/CyaY-like superfamily)
MTVDQYIEKHALWTKELKLLREIMQKTEMGETIKWGAPVYTYQDKNIVGLAAFKAHFGLWFFQGALLSDKEGLLQNAQEGKTQAMRQWRFVNIDEVDASKVLAYVKEAIENQKQGKTVKIEKKPLVIPDELKEVLSQDAELAESFEALTLGKKRDYAEHIETAKREETKQKRLEKIIPMIKQGAGLHDKYKNC